MVLYYVVLLCCVMQCVVLCCGLRRRCLRSLRNLYYVVIYFSYVYTYLSFQICCSVSVRALFSVLLEFVCRAANVCGSLVVGRRYSKYAYVLQCKVFS